MTLTALHTSWLVEPTNEEKQAKRENIKRITGSYPESIPIGEAVVNICRKRPETLAAFQACGGTGEPSLYWVAKYWFGEYAEIIRTH